MRETPSATSPWRGMEPGRGIETERGGKVTRRKVENRREMGKDRESTLEENMGRRRQGTEGEIKEENQQRELQKKK